jgi:hypothetical protein
MNRGKPVAMIAAIPLPTRRRNLGFLKGKLKLLKGWDAPVADFGDYQ